MNKMILAAAKAYTNRYMKPNEARHFMLVIEDMIRLDYFHV